MNLTARILLFGLVAALLTGWPSDARLSAGRTRPSNVHRTAPVRVEVAAGVVDNRNPTLPGERALDDRFRRLRREILTFKSDVYHRGLEGEFGPEVVEMVATIYRIDAMLDEMRTTSDEESLEIRRNVVVSIEVLQRRLSEAVDRSRTTPGEPRFVTDLRHLWQ